MGQDGEFWNGTNGMRGKLSHSSDVIDACICTHTNVDLHVNVYGLAYCCGYMDVDGNVAMAAL